MQTLAALRPVLNTASALAAVLLLIGALAVLARRLKWAPAAPPPQGAIALRGVLALDPRRRLYLVEAAGRQALVLTGDKTDAILALPPDL